MSLSSREMSRFAEALFIAVFGLQFILAFALVPQWTADAITGEKERQTLPFLLVTDLSSWEIVLGKLFARLSQISIFLLAALPILCGLQVYGGIDPPLIAWLMIALAASCVSAAGVSMYASVVKRSTAAAVKLSQRLFSGFTFWPMIALWFAKWKPEIGDFPRNVGLNMGLTVFDALEWLNVGNPIFVAQQCLEAMTTRGVLFADSVYPMLRNFSAFHLGLGLIFVVLAARRLRPVAGDEGDAPAPAKTVASLPLDSRTPIARPPVGRAPIFWKARYFDHAIVRTVLEKRAARSVLFMAFVAPIGLMIYSHFRWGSCREIAIMLSRGATVFVLSFVSVQAAIVAAHSVQRERLKNTLEELLVTDLWIREILGQKWLAVATAGRLALMWVAVQWITGVYIEVVHPAAPILVLLTWAVFHSAATSIGLYWSCRARDSQAAQGGTMLTGLMLVISPFIAMALLSFANQQIAARFPESLYLFLLNLSPPIALGFMTFGPSDLSKLLALNFETWMVGLGNLVALVFYAIVAWSFWRRALVRFSKTVGREQGE